MDDERSKRLNMERQIAAFERENPKVAEAMRLFEMTMVQYQGALHTISGPRIYQSDTTAPLASGQHGKLE